VDVIKEYIQLKPAGVNFRAKCPFHNEKTPSFMVSPDKQIYHCFGCNRGGDILSFVMEMEGLSFVETLRHLAPRAGVVLRAVDSRQASDRNKLLDIMELAVKFYQAALLRSAEAAGAREYLKTRGLDENTIEAWRIGYSPEKWDTLLNFLKGKGFKEEEIFRAGLAVRSEKSAGFYDRFRGRIMFPIMDIGGNPVAFSARISPEREAQEKMGKYINNPQTAIYDKSRILFGLDKAKADIKSRDCAVAVEGQMDVITAHKAGFTNTIASSGTALTGGQIALVKRYTKNIHLAFDADSAGEMALERGVREALQAEMNVKVIAIPKGKDPDDCIRQDPHEWEAAVANARPVVDYFLERFSSKHDIDKPENSRLIAEKALRLIAMFTNIIDRDLWIRRLAHYCGVGEEVLLKRLKEIMVSPGFRQEKTAEAANAGQPEKKSSPREEKLSESLLAILLLYPQNFEYAVNNIDVELVKGGQMPQLYNKLILFYNNKGKEILISGSGQSVSSLFYGEFSVWSKDLSDEEGSIAKIIEREEENLTSENLHSQTIGELKLMNKLVLLGEKDFYNYTEEGAFKEILQIVRALKSIHFIKRKKEIERAIDDLEKRSGDDPNLKKEINLMIREIQSINDDIRGMERETI